MNEMTLFAERMHDSLLSQISFQLNIPRAFFGLSVFQDWIFVAGGRGNTRDCFNSYAYASCEKLNLKTGAREDFPPMLSQKISCHLLCYNYNR